MFNDVRKKIVDICGLNPYSIKELSIELSLNPGSIHNHVKKLYDAGYLIVHETRLINGIEEKKYIRSAEFFSFAELKGEENTTRNRYISNEISKESFITLESDKMASARMTNVKLDKEKYELAQEKLKDLIEFLTTNNGSGNKDVNFIVCMGNREE